jgi:hypothetical protein
MKNELAEWHPVAFVVRSCCHDRTWLAHIPSAGETPAGPLRVVRATTAGMVLDEGEKHRWRHNAEEDCWVLEVFTDAL